MMKFTIKKYRDMARDIFKAFPTRTSHGTGNYYRFILYAIIIVLINAAGMTLFFRADLTANDVYSLSPASRNAVATLSEPLTIKVFFTDNLPAPYNNTERYLRDLLQEYAVAGNRYLNYAFYTVSGTDDETARENRQRAQNYGIHPVQVRVIEQDEVKFQNAFMGMVLIHGDIIETIPAITSTDGLEYQITTTIRKMNDKISALLRVKDSISVKLYLSSSLQVVGPLLNLSELSNLPKKIEERVQSLNGRNYGKLSFVHLDPSAEKKHEKEAKQLNVLSLRWNDFKDQRGRTIKADKGYAGIVVQHGERTELIQLLRIIEIPLFGTQYQLADLATLEETINEAVESLININEEIGYLADHGTHALASGAPGTGQPGDRDSLTNFHSLVSESYTIQPLSLKTEDIPEGLSLLIIAGPKERFTDHELYQIDQHLMKGKNLALFLDSFNEIVPPQQGGMMFGQNQGPVYLPINTGLEKLLAHYGVTVTRSYILDENCFRQRMSQLFGGGERPIYFAPIVQNEKINDSMPLLNNIKGLVMLKASPVQVDETRIKEHGLQVSRLFSSSDRSWELSGKVTLNPLFLTPPAAEEKFKSIPMAYLLEGSFPSYFADKQVPHKEIPTEDTAAAKRSRANVPVTGEALIRKGKRGTIFLVGTSEILKNNVLDQDGVSPNAQFIMNVIDTLNGREDIALMRTKTQTFNPLKPVKPGTRAFVKITNIAGLPVLVVVAGVVIWFRRAAAKRAVQEIFRE